MCNLSDPAVGVRWPPFHLSAQKPNAAAMVAFWEGSAGCVATRGQEYSATAKDDSFYPTTITVWGIMLRTTASSQNKIRPWSRPPPSSLSERCL